MSEEDIETLRGLLLAGPLGAGTRKDIIARFKTLGLTDTSPGKSIKAELVRHTVNSLTPGAVEETAAKVLDKVDLTANLRNGLQNVLWRNVGPEIEERTRRDAAAAVDIEDLVHDHRRFEALLDRWWVLGDAVTFGTVSEDVLVSSLFGGPPSLRKQIQQNVLRNLGDWSFETLIDQVGAFETVDRRFAGFIEDLVSHAVLLTEEHQRKVVDSVNPVFKKARLELREVDRDGGYPVYRLVSTQTPMSRPKTVIFASRSKPDLRVSDALAGDIEIVDARGALVYDAPIGADGLRFETLRRWWSTQNPSIEGSATANALYDRLVASLPPESPPQRRLFWAYHHLYRDRLGLIPALLPEVWMHWDPKTLRERGAGALLGQRMDFLMLAPNDHRIILEVDGSTHYTDDHGKPSPARYAKNTSYDRDMQLRGYSVYRFGAHELGPDKGPAEAILAEFFDRMLAKHNVEL